MKSVRYEGRIVGGKRAMHEGHVSLVGKWATIITSCVDVAESSFDVCASIQHGFAAAYRDDS